MIERSVTKRYPFEMIFENTILTIDYMIPFQIVHRLSSMLLLSFSCFFLFSFLLLFINSVPYEKRYAENIFLKFGRIESHETIRQTNTIGGGGGRGTRRISPGRESNEKIRKSTRGRCCDIPCPVHLSIGNCTDLSRCVSVDKSRASVIKRAPENLQGAI